MKYGHKQRICSVLAVLWLFAAVFMFLCSAFLSQISPERDLKHKLSCSDEQRETIYYSCQLRNGTKITLPAVPHFIIAGAQKAGTSALGSILEGLPGFSRSTLFEPHFFDRKVRPHYKNKSQPPDICAVQQEYAQHFEQNISSKIVFEKSPAYLPNVPVPERIAKVCWWKPKIIVILRNPVDRAFSHFQMGGKEIGLNKSFEEMINQEVKEWRKINLTQAPLHKGRRWRRAPEEAFVPPLNLPARQRQQSIQNANLARGMLSRGLYAQQLHHWIRYFPLGEQLLVVHYERFLDDKATVINEILQFVGAPPLSLDTSILNADHSPPQKRNETNVRELSNDARGYLQRLYRPYNDELAELLGAEWQGVWN